MSSNDSLTDPLEFTRKIWSQMGFSLPGMVTPTFDVDELEKRLADLKTVEAWLKMNLSMLQLTIQGLEMQCTTLNAVRSIGNLTPPELSFPPGQSNAKTADQGDAPQSAMWPWALMQQIQSQVQELAEKQVASFAPEATAKAKAEPKKP